MDDIVSDAKQIIDRGDLAGLQEYYKDIFDSEDTDDIDIPYLFRHIYVHACLKKKQEIAAWLKELYETMDPIIKIALRQIFAYGDYLMKNNKN
jgi:hypothetical protein